MMISDQTCNCEAHYFQGENYEFFRCKSPDTGSRTPTQSEKSGYAEHELRLAVIKALGFYNATAIRQIVTGVFHKMGALVGEDDDEG